MKDGERKIERRRADFTRSKERENKGAMQERCERGRATRTIRDRGIRCNHEEKEDYRPAVQLRCWILIGWLTFGLTRLGFISRGEDR